MRVVMMHQTGGPDVLVLEQAEAPQPATVRFSFACTPSRSTRSSGSTAAGCGPRSCRPCSGATCRGRLRSRARTASRRRRGLGLAAGAYAELAVAAASGSRTSPPESARAGRSASGRRSDRVAGAVRPWRAAARPDRADRRRGGGVGHLAVQFASHAGARTIGTAPRATATSSRSRRRVRRLRAPAAGRRGERRGRGPRPVGGETTSSLVAVLRSGGVLVTIATLPRSRPRPSAARARELLMMSPSSEQLARIAQLVATERCGWRSSGRSRRRGRRGACAQRSRSHQRKLVLVVEPG